MNCRYIPAEHLHRLNHIAKRRRKNHLSEDCPILECGFNVPVFMALSGIDEVGWVRCLLPTSPDCTSSAFLDVRLAEFERLPVVEIPASERQPS